MPAGLSPPPQHVAEAWQSAEFFTTRVLKEFKDKGGEAHAAWVRCDCGDLMLLVTVGWEWLGKECDQGV